MNPVRHIYHALAVTLIMTATVSAQARMTKDEALARHFAGLEVTRSTAFLTEAEQRAIATTARAKVESRVVTYYTARKDGRLVGTAFFETQTIRTMPATIMVIIDPDTTVRTVELVSFYEPSDYRPPERWLEQFRSKGAGDDLYLKRGLRAIAGATLTSQSISEGVRRLLNTYVVAIARTLNP